MIATSGPRLARTPLGETAEDAARALAAALEDVAFRGWDPYDALSSPIVRRLAPTRWMRICAIQAFRRSPVNVRPLARIPQVTHAKALALLVSGHVRLYRPTLDERHLRVARALCERLVEQRVELPSGVGWGYEFDVQTRWGFYPRGRPNAVVTAFAAHALLDLADVDPGIRGIESLLDGVVGYAMCDLMAEHAGLRYFAYYPKAKAVVHNASALVASVIARAARDRLALDGARAAVDCLLRYQRPDGSWPYGEGRGLGWIDGYHTAYVLERLAECAERLERDDALAAVRVGLRFYRARLFEPSGAPRASTARSWPHDAHAASSAVTALSKLGTLDESAIATCRQVLAWALRALVLPDGRFAYQRTRHYTNRIRYIRWSDAHMLLALASYLLLVEGRDGRS